MLASSIQQSDSVMYFFPDSFPFKSYYKIFNIVPCAISRFILVFANGIVTRLFMAE